MGTGIDNSPSWLSRIVFGRNPKRTAVRAVLLIILSLVAFKFVLMPIRVVGISMAPNYIHGQIKFVNRLAYLKARPKRGDVVAIRINGARAVLLKRVIGLPGETIAVEQGTVRINGEPLEELYVKNQKAPWQIPEQTLANDEYYVIGDNREMRQSNHDHGPVNERDIAGKVLF